MENRELMRKLELVIENNRTARDKLVKAVQTGVWQVVAQTIASVLNVALQFVNRAANRLWEFLRGALLG